MTIDQDFVTVNINQSQIWNPKIANLESKNHKYGIQNSMRMLQIYIQYIHYMYMYITNMTKRCTCMHKVKNLKSTPTTMISRLLTELSHSQMEFSQVLKIFKERSCYQKV